jgi:AcrR family transcriptional regulator
VANAPRTRLEPEARRAQLVGLGLQMLSTRPLDKVAIDDIAAEAGISRGLLFHYFPTKRDFHRACIEAAGRRILRNTRADDGLEPADQVTAMVRLLVEQIDRRRDFYLSLLHGTGTADLSLVEVYDGIWEEATRRVVTALGLPGTDRPVVHAWWAYVEDHALSWSADPPGRRTRSLDDLVDHCTRALHALLGLGRGRGTSPEPE